MGMRRKGGGGEGGADVCPSAKNIKYSPAFAGG